MKADEAARGIREEGKNRVGEAGKIGNRTRIRGFIVSFMFDICQGYRLVLIIKRDRFESTNPVSIPNSNN